MDRFRAMFLLTALVGSSHLACSNGSSSSGSGGATASSSSDGGAGGSGSGGDTSRSKGGDGGASQSGGNSVSGGSSGGAGSSAGSKSGGSTQSSSTGGAGASCPNPSNVASCGGDVVGTWSVTSSCLALSGTINPRAANMECDSAPVTGALRVTGSLTAKPDGNYSDNTETSGALQFTLAKDCLVISSTPIECDQAGGVLGVAGYGEVTCVNGTNGGCACSAKVQQKGSMGVLLATPSSTGKFKASGSTLTLSGEDSPEVPYAYCVSETTLTLSAQTSVPVTTGTIVLQKQVVSTGGTGGSAGKASGGTTSTGGATTSGGTASGGRTSSGGTTSASSGGSTGGNSNTGSTPTGSRPCDIFAAANTPCVAAHSTVRALFADYSKALYQVRKGGTWDAKGGVTGGETKDIMVAPGTGIADAAAHEQFCGTTSKACTISAIYDQTGNGNDFKVAKMCDTCSGCPGDANKKGAYDMEAYADLAKTTINGKVAYGVRILPCGNASPNQTGYRSTTPKGTATGDQPESVYFVVDGASMNGGCCFDYGNSNPNGTASGNMDAVYIGSYQAWGTGAGSGPWVGADLEAGIYTWNGKSGNWKNPNSLSLKFPFVTALLKNNQNGKTAEEGPFVLKGGDARSGSLTTMWSGARPSGYEVLKKYGGLVLGIGGDGAAGTQGTFFEGAVTASFNAKATDEALQANIIAAGYGK